MGYSSCVNKITWAPTSNMLRAFVLTEPMNDAISAFSAAFNPDMISLKVVVVQGKTEQITLLRKHRWVYNVYCILFAIRILTMCC